MLDTPGSANLQDFLRARVQALIADANGAGWGTPEVLAALSNVVRDTKHEYNEDPDPADEPDLLLARGAPVEIPASVLEDIDTEQDVPRAG